MVERWNTVTQNQLQVSVSSMHKWIYSTFPGLETTVSVMVWLPQRSGLKLTFFNLLSLLGGYIKRTVNQSWWRPHVTNKTRSSSSFLPFGNSLFLSFQTLCVCEYGKQSVNLCRGNQVRLEPNDGRFSCFTRTWFQFLDEAKKQVVSWCEKHPSEFYK